MGRGHLEYGGSTRAEPQRTLRFHLGGVTRGDEEVPIGLVEGIDVVPPCQRLRHEKRRIRVTRPEIGHIQPEIGGHQLAKPGVLYLVRSGHDRPCFRYFRLRSDSRALSLEPCPLRNPRQPV